MTGRMVLAAVVAIGLTVLTSFSSRVPVTFASADEAHIRLAWRADGVTVEACATQSAEELAALPVHMRNPASCIGQLAPFAVTVQVDGATVHVDTVSPGGARGDRPIFVFDELVVPAGRRQVAVRFSAILPALDAEPTGKAEYAWAGPLTLAPGDVALVTIDDLGEMVVKTLGGR